MRVVLPAPFCPTSATTAPSGRRSSTSRSAHLPARLAVAAGYRSPTSSKRMPVLGASHASPAARAPRASLVAGIARYSNRFDMYSVSS